MTRIALDSTARLDSTRRFEPPGSAACDGLFVTGTDTGVGKTLVTAALAAWCRQRGLDVGVMKPAATGGILRHGDGGVRPRRPGLEPRSLAGVGPRGIARVKQPGADGVSQVGDVRRRAFGGSRQPTADGLPRRGVRSLVSEDAIRLAKAAGVDDSLSLINPVCYRDPLAPWPASQRERRPVSWPAILRAYATLRRRHERLLVEGVGGLLVPITRRRRVLELAQALSLPVLIVARLRLGTLNHTLLTIECAQRAGLRVVGIVLNACDSPLRDAGSRLAERTNPAVLRACAPVPVLGVLPHRPSLVDGWDVDALSRWIDGALDPAFLGWLRWPRSVTGQRPLPVEARRVAQVDRGRGL